MKSQADRSRAKRYRAIPAAKRTPEQRRFLATYDEPTDEQPRRPLRVVPPAEPDEPAAHDEHDEPITPPPDVSREAAPREVPIRDVSKPAATTPHEHAPAVGPCKPDCPACLGQLGSVTPYHCPRTNLDVWPEISDGTAETIAGALLGLIGRITAWLGVADHYEPPSPVEVRLMARSIKAWIRRYMGGMARYDESIAPITTAGAYVGRLSRLPAKASEAA